MVVRRLLAGAVLLALAGCGQVDPSAAAANLAPVAEAGGDLAVQLGEAVRFDGSASFDPDGQIVAWRWTFGDGSAAEGAVSTHAFSAPGRYLVALAVTDDADETANDEAIIEVAEPQAVAAARLPASAHALQPLAFDASASTAPVGLVAWRWSFGDGATAEGEQATHAYARQGSYRVRLVVEDALGRTGSFAETLEVQPADVAGTYALVVSPARFGCGPYDATFEDSALTIQVDGTGAVTATGSTGRIYSGTLDGGALSLSGTYLGATGGSCPKAPVQAAVRGTFQDAGGFTGSVSAYYDLAVGCQCSASFQVSAVRR